MVDYCDWWLWFILMEHSICRKVIDDTNILTTILISAMISYPGISHIVVLVSQLVLNIVVKVIHQLFSPNYYHRIYYKPVELITYFFKWVRVFFLGVSIT